MSAESLVRKAARLYTEGKVRRVHDHVYAVIGDHGTYLVCLADRARLALAVPNDALPPLHSCTCPATGACSHIIGAERQRQDDAEREAELQGFARSSA
jgi:hypothetical protein